MAPEQFHGRATFASDIYSLGVTMYQMMTGVLPYHTPAPADLERLMRGDMVAPPRTRNGRIPQLIDDIIMKAMAPDVSARYQTASEVLEDLLGAAHRPAAGRTTDRTGRVAAAPPEPAPPQAPSWSRSRETPQPRFCWHCRKPLHARSDRCPFCGEAQ
jgi:serine/threonine protein kinase